MQTMVTVRRFGAVVGLTAALVGAGGATATAFADSTSTNGIIGTATCPPGYRGIIVSVNGNDVLLCTNAV